MSAKATFWAWEREGLKASSKMVLLCLANNHNEDTDRCDPGIKYISRKTLLNEKTVRSCLRELEDSGLIRTIKRPGTTPNYVFIFGSGDLFNSSKTEQNTPPNIGTTKIGSTQNRDLPKTAETPTNIGRGVLPKLVPESKSESKKNLKDIYKGLDLSKIPEAIDREIIVEYINHREAIKKKMTQGALDRILQTALSVQGNQFLNISPNQAILEAIDAGWTGLKIDWLVNRLQGQGYAANQTSNRNGRTGKLSTIEQSSAINRAHHEQLEREIAELEARENHDGALGVVEP